MWDQQNRLPASSAVSVSHPGHDMYPGRLEPNCGVSVGTSHAAHKCLQSVDTLGPYSCHGYGARCWQGPGIVGNLGVWQRAANYIFVSKRYYFTIL
mgnify:CR=1 FL=1